MNGLHVQAQILKKELGLSSLSQAFELLAKTHGLKTPNELTAQSYELNSVQLNIAQKASPEKVRTSYDAKLNLNALTFLEVECAQETEPADIAKNLDSAAKKIKELAKLYREGASEALTAAQPEKRFLAELRNVHLDKGTFDWTNLKEKELEVSFRPKIGTVVIGRKIQTTNGSVTVGMLFSQAGDLLDLKCAAEPGDKLCGEHKLLTEKIYEAIQQAEPKSVKIVPFFDLHNHGKGAVAFGVPIKRPDSRKYEFIRIRGSSSPFKLKEEAEHFVKTVRGTA